MEPPHRVRHYRTYELVQWHKNGSWTITTKRGEVVRENVATMDIALDAVDAELSH